MLGCVAEPRRFGHGMMLVARRFSCQYGQRRSLFRGDRRCRRRRVRTLCRREAGRGSEYFRRWHGRAERAADRAEPATARGSRRARRSPTTNEARPGRCAARRAGRACPRAFAGAGRTVSFHHRPAGAGRGSGCAGRPQEGPRHRYDRATLRLMSQSLARKARRAGTRAYRDFRREMLGRARFRCERCGRRPPNDRDLHVHHPHEVAEGGEALDYGNAEVVCVTCHRRHHSAFPGLPEWDET